MTTAAAGVPEVAAPLVGRDRELERLESLLTTLRRGGGGFVAIVGEAGIGKTRLLEELVARTDSHRELVLRGRAAEFLRGMPFALVIDALNDQLRQLDLERLGDDCCQELAAVFPALAGGGNPIAASHAERYRRHYAVKAALMELARDAPLVLALDDVHWADEASLELLAYLLSRPLEVPLLVALAFRPQGAPALLVNAVQGAVRDGTLESLELAALSREQVDAVLGSQYERDRRRVLFVESGGNPFYLEQLARVPVDPGRRSRDDHADRGVPRAVAISLAQELDLLQPQARVLAMGAAVLGDPFEFDLAAQVAGLPAGDAERGLDELIARGLVRPTATPRHFAFRHPIVRRAVYEASGDGWRIGAHGRAVSALTGRGEHASVVAHHVEHAARPGDADAIELLGEAGHRAATESPRLAARWFQAALRLLAPTDATEQRLELLVASATALMSAGQIAESRSALIEALSLLPCRASEQRATVACMLAQAEALLGHHAEARDLLADSVSGLGPNRAREHAMLAAEMAVDHLRTGERDEAHRWALDAVAAAERVDDAALRCTACALLSLIEYARGEVSAARRRADVAGGIARRTANRSLAGQLSGVFYLAMAEVRLGRFESALEHGARGLAIAEATGNTSVIPPIRLTIAHAQFALGRLDESAATAQAMLDVARPLGIDQYLVWAHAACAFPAVRRGDVSRGVDHAERAAAHARSAPKGLYSWLGGCALAEALVAAGQPERARQVLLDHAGGPDLPLVDVADCARWYDVLVEAELALGDIEAASDWAERSMRTVADLGHVPARAMALRNRAAALIAAGDAAAGVAPAREASHAFAACGAELEAARADVILGRALADTGDVKHAVSILESAYRTLDALDAGRSRDDAANALRRLARRVPRRGRRGDTDRDGIGALSGREREVADLVEQGRTNKAIASTLYLSERTVENHLSNIFRKLGVTSRTEVARELARAKVVAG